MGYRIRSACATLQVWPISHDPIKQGLNKCIVLVEAVRLKMCTFTDKLAKLLLGEKITPKTS